MRRMIGHDPERGCRWALSMLLGTVALFFCAVGHSAVSDALPNIVLIVADDLGYGDIGVNGATAIRTPQIDRLAREGVQLTNFYSSANVCTPSRAGLLTGRYAARVGLAVGVLFPHSDYGLPQSELTLAEALGGAGYRTAMVGKWHLGTVAGTGPMDHGFQHFLGVPYSANMAPLPLLHDRELVTERPDVSALTSQFTEEAVRVIESPDVGPFFLYVAYTAPHVPIEPSVAFHGRSKAGKYGDVIEEIDASVGALRAALERTGKARDTLVIFTSDNGPWFQGSAGNRRGRKGGTFEGGYAVPFIAWQPGRIPAGQRSDAMAMNIDVFPTLLARAGVELPKDRMIDGRDIWPLLQGGTRSPHDVLYFFSNDKIAAVRKPDWRYVVRTYYQTYDMPLDIPALGGELLFDLRADPREHYDVSDRHPDVVRAMRAVIEGARTEFGAVPQRRTEPRITATSEPTKAQ